MMDAQNNWSDRTDLAMEQNDNIDQGAAITASPASRVFNEEYFAKNIITRQAIQGRNAYAAWARKLGLTKKDDPEFMMNSARQVNTLRIGAGALDTQQIPKKQSKTKQAPKLTGSAKQPAPPPRPDISGYRKVEPTLQYAAALQGETTERPRITPPSRPTGDARFNAGVGPYAASMSDDN
ncbi:hypothetical protein NPIL_410051 [Nephila pilipes]|uniref:Uncharacterized protein n=1 Tax=Nephila pilipes TaxID=299642 RepID=A0A8X6NDR5_NEPPI|nr:hypothetical protein NPIL_410051 [Nephila pilipes]